MTNTNDTQNQRREEWMRHSENRWTLNHILGDFPKTVSNYGSYGFVESDAPIDLGRFIPALMKDNAGSLEKLLTLNTKPGPVGGGSVSEFTSELMHKYFHEINALSVHCRTEDYQVPIVKTYIEHMSGAFEAAKCYNGVRVCYSALGLKEESERYLKIFGIVIGQDTSREPEESWLRTTPEEDDRKAKGIIREYLEVFKQHLWYNFDVNAYLADQKAQWQALREKGEQK